MYDHQNGTTAKLQRSTLLRKIPDSALYLPWFISIFSHEEYLHYWGRNYNYYCQVIPRCQDSCCTGEGGFLGPKRLTHHRSSQVKAVAASWKD